MLKTSREYLSKLVHTMAHDFKGSLHNIMGYAELLKDEQNLMFVDKIMQIAKKQSELVALSVELVDAGLLVDITDSINLDELVRSAAKETLPREIDYLQDSLPEAVGDTQRIRQIFINLFLMALQSEKTTRIEVRLRESASVKEVLVCNDGDKTLTEDLTKEMRLECGLAVVECIINAHGWNSKVESDDMNCFCIHIPRNE